jgi:hypothetical protein
VEQTDQKLREAFQKLEEAINLFEEMLLVTQEQSQEEHTMKKIGSLKIRVSEKKHLLDPETQFEDIISNSEEIRSSIPPGHDVTLFYNRSPFQSTITYQSKPVTTKPWLSYTFYKTK